MPASKKTAAKQDEINGRALAQGQKAPGTRALKRAVAKKSAPAAPQAAENATSARRAPQDPSAYAASVWGTEATFELTTPSGQKCLCREVGVESFIEAGLLEAINALGGIVDMEILPKARGQKPVDMQKLMANPKQLVEVMAIVNKVVCMGVVAPQVYPIVEADGSPVERVNGRVYVDTISMTDRMFLFTEMTGNLENLASFRS